MDEAADYRFRADALGEAEDGSPPTCFIQFREHATPDCSDGFSQLDAVPQTPGSWSTADATLFGGGSPGHFIRFAVGVQEGEGTGAQACNFDNIRITIDRIETAPALGTLSLAAVAALTAVAGMLVVRSRAR